MLACAATALLLSGCGDQQDATSAVAEDACPNGADRVPAAPAGFDGAAVLVPAGSPADVLVCSYPQLDRSGLGVSGDRTQAGRVTQGLDHLADSLRLPEALPEAVRTCPVAGGPVVPVLVRLRYPSGAVAWLSSRTDVNGCARVTNGSFVSAFFSAETFVEAAATGRWPESDVPGPCQGGVRAGQERHLLMPGWTSLRVCQYDDDGVPSVSGALASERADQVATVLASLPTQPSQGGCSNTPGGSPVRTDLVAEHPGGVQTALSLDLGCVPALDNGSLASAPSKAQLAELARLLELDAEP